MKTEIENIIKSTLVIQNKTSVKYAVSKILNILSPKPNRDVLIAAAKGIYPNGDLKQQERLIDKYLTTL